MGDNSSINIVARNLQRAARKMGRNVSKNSARSVSGHHSKAKSKSRNNIKAQKYVFKEKKFRAEGRRKKRDLEESDLFGSSEDDGIHEEERMVERQPRTRNKSRNAQEKNFILRNKKMLEDLKRRKQESLEKKRKRSRMKKKYSHVKSKIQNKADRSHSRISQMSHKRKSRSISMRPAESPIKKQKPSMRSRHKKYSKSPNKQRTPDLRPAQNRDMRGAQEVRGKSRKFKGFKGGYDDLEEEYEREMEKYKTRRGKEKRGRENRSANRSQQRRTDHHTKVHQSRKKEKKRNKSRYASPVP